ncbi:MAG TPA: hypothetical protein VIL36_21845 [Acidimicrobiales bacterium]
MPLLALGASDCEALRGGWLGQPVNALSSLAYVAAGVEVWRRGGPAPVAGALAAVGVGSALYHGPMPPGAEALHDGSIVALGAALAVAGLRGRLDRPATFTPWLLGGVAVTLNLLTRTGAPLCRPHSLLQGHAAWHVLTAAAVALWAGAGSRRGPRGGRAGHG